MRSPGWLADRRLVAGAVLILSAVLGAFVFRTAGAGTRPALVAAHDLPSGHVVVADDLAESGVDVGESWRHLVPAERKGEVIGRALSRRVASGELLRASDLTDPGPPRQEVSIPVAADRAPSGRVQPGDRVDVLATYGEGTAKRTVVVAHDVEVVSVTTQDALLGGGSTSAISALTVASDARTAALLVFAGRSAEVDVVRSTGSHAAPVAVGYDDLDRAGGDTGG